MSSRDLLVREGSRLMRRGGYTDCGLVELLDAAGLPRGSFYHHFGSKEGFALEVIEAFYDWHDRRLAALGADPERSAPDRLRDYFELLLERASATADEERGCLLAMLALEKSATSDAIRDSLRTVFSRWQERIAELVRQGQRTGEIGSLVPAPQLAGLLLHGWEGTLLRARLERDLEPLRDFVAIALPRLLA